MPVQTPHDLFLTEMADMYDAEQRIVQMLPQLAQESTDPDVRSAFQHHEQETRHQIQNLEKCFQQLGSQPQRTACYAVQGIKQEHDHFTKESPSPDILCLFDLGGASKTEYYEIASYKGLIEQANLMGHSSVVQLLQENLQQEENMAQTVEQLGKKLGKQHIKPMASAGR
jgi:ferritin-like metal-binding protein YciE